MSIILKYEVYDKVVQLGTMAVRRGFPVTEAFKDRLESMVELHPYLYADSSEFDDGKYLIEKAITRLCREVTNGKDLGTQREIDIAVEEFILLHMADCGITEPLEYYFGVKPQKCVAHWEAEITIDGMKGMYKAVAKNKKAFIEQVKKEFGKCKIRKIKYHKGFVEYTYRGLLIRKEI